MAAAVVTLMVMAVLPPYAVFGAGFVIAAFEGILLVLLMINDPGRIDDRSRRVRNLSIALVGLLIFATLASTVVLVNDLLSGAPETAGATRLLLLGGKVWVENNVAFALLYWQFDGGGPSERAHGLPRYPDLGFPQVLDPSIAPPDWRPQFVDYLYLAFTTANAFSPTDTAPLVTWAKVAMAVQALISFVILGLIIARAVNAFA